MHAGILGSIVALPLDIKLLCLRWKSRPLAGNIKSLNQRSILFPMFFIRNKEIIADTTL
jgi:hypothetical protein